MKRTLARQTPFKTAQYGKTRDDQIRFAAFEHVKRLSEKMSLLNWGEIEKGFLFNGEKICLGTRLEGIFKPRQMESVLSIKTVIPTSGRKIWYRDQEAPHQEIFNSEGSVEYAFTGNDPESPKNQLLRQAFERQIPIIYFLAVAPGVYQVILPTFITDWNRHNMSIKICFGLINGNEIINPQTSADVQKFAIRETRQRLYQARFRTVVMEAYNNRCAFSGLPAGQLLDAAHIIPYGETVGKPIEVTNGLALSKLHHEAFDRHLIGLDCDYRIHVSEQLLESRDGPQLALLKGLHKKSIHFPKYKEDYPNPESLAVRFEEFEFTQNQRV